MNEKPIKEMTPEELKAYRHKMYIKHREERLKWTHDYYIKHRDEIKFREKNRYRVKCGLKPLKKKGE